MSFVQKKLITKIDNNQSWYRANKIRSFAGCILTFVLILVVFSSKLSGISTALGVAGAGVAFALQEVIASFAGWLAIMFGNFFRTGDRVQLGGIKGDVMDIGVLRTTIIETGQWDEITVPIQYGSNYELTTKILNEAGKEVVGDLTTDSKADWNHLQQMYRLEDAQTEPMVSLMANDNWVQFTLRYVVPFKRRRATKTDLFMAILKRVENTNGAVKFASATFQLVDSPDFKVNLNKESNF